MNAFSAKVETEAVVAASKADIWAVLTDPVLLPKLTPLLDRIDADGDVWRWHMISIAALGVSILPVFTEQMTFQPDTRIDYTHRAPAGTSERAGADGWYQLSDVGTEGAAQTKLAISLELTVELPLPKATGPAVRRVMTTTMNRTGDRFAANLLAHLGVDGSRPARR